MSGYAQRDGAAIVEIVDAGGCVCDLHDALLSVAPLRAVHVRKITSDQDGLQGFLLGELH